MGNFKQLTNLTYLQWVLNTLQALPLLNQPKLLPLEPLWVLTSRTGMISRECHTSHPELHLSSKNALPQMSGKHAKTEEINTVSLSNKLSSPVLSGPTLVLVSTLDPTILTTPSPHFSTRSSRITTDMVSTINTSPTWTTRNLTAHHSLLTRTR